MAKEITIAVPEGKSAQWINNVLTLVDEQKKDDRPVTERIKTFEDAYNELGKDHRLCIEYDALMNNTGYVPSLYMLSMMKICIITAALNEGWIPEFKKGEYRYSPWFELFTQNEIDAMSDEEKESKQLCLVGGNANNGLYCGLACVDSDGAFSGAHACLGSRLAYRTSDLAKYSGKQFCEIWKNIIFEK